jgi:hypothetical protein
MKPLFSLLLTICLFSIQSNGQIRKIPSSVTEALKTQYPKATTIEWSDKLTGYAATFNNDGVKLVAYYKNDATWERTEEPIAFEDLPEEVQTAKDKSKYSEWDTGIIEKILLPEDKTQYRVQVEKSDFQKKNLYFTPDGKLLKDKMTL